MNVYVLYCKLVKKTVAGISLKTPLWLMKYGKEKNYLLNFRDWYVRIQDITEQ